jgi:hypothetical protein
MRAPQKPAYLAVVLRRLRVERVVVNTIVTWLAMFGKAQFAGRMSGEA